MTSKLIHIFITFTFLAIFNNESVEINSSIFHYRNFGNDKAIAKSDTEIVAPLSVNITLNETEIIESDLAQIGTTSTALDDKDTTTYSVEEPSHYNQVINIVNDTLLTIFNSSDTYKQNVFEIPVRVEENANANHTFKYHEKEFPSELFGDNEVKTSNGERDYNFQDIIKDLGSYISIFINNFVSDSMENECRNHSLFYINHLRNYTTWAVKMLDSTAKIPDGILLGNIRHLGNFDECLSVKAMVQVGDKHIQDEIFKGKYCLANIKFSVKDGHHKHELEEFLNIMTGGRRSLEITRSRKWNFLLHFALFEWAVCAPSTCTAGDLEAALNRIFNMVIGNMGLEVDVMVAEESCYVENKFALYPRDFVMIAIILILLLMIGGGSAYDIWYKAKYGKETGVFGDTLLAFSIPNNLKKLLNVNVPPGTIKCLDSIRLLSMLWVIFTHKVLIMCAEPWINKLYMLESVETFWKMPLQNSMLNVDTFFVIGGMLRAYNMMNELEQHNFHYLSGFLQRYLRLTPAYGITLGFFATLLPYLGNGPTWKGNIGVNSENCRSNWFLNMLYVNNYIDGVNMCMPHSWYLAADMQLFLVSPFIIYPLWKWKNLGKFLLGFVSLISIAVIFITIVINRYLGVHSVGFHDTMLQDYTTEVYLPTHMRISSYIVGIGLGYVFHKLEEHKEFKLSKLWNLIGWAFCLVTLFGVVFGPYKMMTPGSPYQHWEQSLYGALHRFSWALAVSWIIFVCHRGYGGMVNKLLSVKLVSPLSRLSYCVYLVHLAVIMVGSSKLRTALYMDDYFIIHDFITDTVISLVIAAILFLCVEQPFLNLTKMIFQRKK